MSSADAAAGAAVDHPNMAQKKAATEEPVKTISAEGLGPARRSSAGACPVSGLFEKGDLVEWTGFDDDVPVGQHGEVIGSAEGFVRVAFPSGTYRLKPSELTKAAIPNNLSGSMVCTGDDVVTADYNMAVNGASARVSNARFDMREEDAETEPAEEPACAGEEAPGSNRGGGGSALQEVPGVVAEGMPQGSRPSCFLADRCSCCGKRQGFLLGFRGLGLRQHGHHQRCSARAARRNRGSAAPAGALTQQVTPLQQPEKSPSLTDKAAAAGAAACHDEPQSSRPSAFFSAVSRPSHELPRDGDGMPSQEALRQRMEDLLQETSSDGRLVEACKDYKQQQERVRRESYAAQAKSRARARDAFVQSSKEDRLWGAVEKLRKNSKGSTSGPSEPVGIPETVITRWSMDLTHMLGPQSTYEPDKGLLLNPEMYTSVSEAVESLIAGTVAPAQGYCIVLSASKSSYFLVYRSDKMDEVFQRFEFSSDIEQEEGSPQEEQQGSEMRGAAMYGVTPLRFPLRDAEPQPAATPRTRSPPDSGRRSTYPFPFSEKEETPATPREEIPAQRRSLPSTFGHARQRSVGGTGDAADDRSGRPSANTQMKEKLAERRRMIEGN